MKKFWLFITLLVCSSLLVGCNNKVTQNVAKEIVDNNKNNDYSWSYISIIPYKAEWSADFWWALISDIWNTEIPWYSMLQFDYTWFKYWDIVRVNFDWSYTGDWTIDAPIVINNIYNMEKIWDIRDSLFTNRDNSDYKLKIDKIERPIIDSYIIDTWTDKQQTIYTYTYKDLWIKITTSDSRFLDKQDLNPYNLFERNWNKILFNNGDISEYVSVYTKEENESLRDIIIDRHLNQWCMLNDNFETFGLLDNRKNTYYIGQLINSILYDDVTCFPDDEDSTLICDPMTFDSSNIIFYIPDNTSKTYLKIKYTDWPCKGCDYWPLEWNRNTIFWKIETL